jgi:hypothetical protein
MLVRLSMSLSMNCCRLTPRRQTTGSPDHSSTCSPSPCRVISDTHNPLAAGSSPARPTWFDQAKQLQMGLKLIIGVRPWVRVSLTRRKRLLRFTREVPSHPET